MRHHQGAGAVRCNQQYIDIARIGVGQVGERDRHLAKRTGEVRDADGRWVRFGRTGLHRVRRVWCGGVRDDDGVGADEGERVGQSKAEAYRRIGVGAILKLEHRADAAPADAAGGEAEGTAYREAAGKENAIGLRVVGGNRNHAIGGQQSGHQIPGADIAAIAQAQDDGDGFPGVNRTVDWPALSRQRGAGSRDACKGRCHHS